MAKYFGYARISSDGQSKFSIEDQENFLKSRANELGLEFDFRPEVKSGTTQNGRNVLLQVINDAQKGDYVGVAYQDRFGRGGASDIVMIEDLTDRGINVELRGKRYDPTNPSGVFNDGMLMLVAQFQSKHQGYKAKQGILQSRNSGKFTFKSDLYGYQRKGMINGKLIIEIDNHEAEIISSIYKDYRNGLGYVKIAENLNESGIRSRNEKKFSPSRIRTIIHNPIYAGMYDPTPPKLDCGIGDRNHLTPERMVKSQYYLPIIPPEEWWDTYRNRKVINSSYKQRRYQNRSFEVTGLLRCSWCEKRGKRVAYTHGLFSRKRASGNKTEYGIYTTRQHLVRCPVLPKQYKEEILEALFQASLILLFMHPKEQISFVIKELVARKKQQEDIAIKVRTIEEKITELNQRRKRVELAIEKSLDEDIDGLIERRSEISQQILQLKNEVTKLQIPFQLKREELEKLSQKFSLDTLEKFFSPETPPSERRKIYFSFIKTSYQKENTIEICFKNGFEVKIHVHVAIVQVYQTDFLINVTPTDGSEFEAVILWDKEKKRFSIRKIRNDGKADSPLDFVERVQKRDFKAISKKWEKELKKSGLLNDKKELSIETLARFHDVSQ